MEVEISKAVWGGGEKSFQILYCTTAIIVDIMQFYVWW